MYDDIPIAHVLNYVLADAFDETEETNPLIWLGSGMTLAELAGPEVSAAFYTDERSMELRYFIEFLGLDQLEAYLSESDDKRAIHLSLRNYGELIFMPGNPEGTPWFMTERFQSDRKSAKATP